MASHTLPARLLVVLALAGAALLAAAVAPGRAAAADPDHVNFTLEGCRPDAPKTFSGALPFLCDDSEYTTGNLGKFWNELDLVPHRLTAETGTNNPGYDVTITADYLDGNCAAFLPAPGEYSLAAVPVTQAMIDAGCAPGYDYITEPTLNPALSSGTCTITSGDPMVLVPGAGGTDASIYREVRIAQSAGSRCVWDYDERLALGSHLFSGSSLHSNMLNENFGTAGVGARDISIPVKEIQPQTLSKTMSAVQGESNVWNVSKSSDTSNVDFPNVCDPNGTREQQVEITVTWTKTTTPAGLITVRTVVTANNPAHRALTINVEDKIYEGTGQDPADLVHTENSGDVPLPPGSHVVLDYSETFTSGTEFNGVATATYKDPVLGNQPIGGVTSAGAASAVVQGVSGANDSAVITDTEDVSGTGIEFSVDSRDPAALGGYGGGYSEGTFTDQPVTWSSGTVTGSGSVTFTKTVRVNGSASTGGVLTDQAQVLTAPGNPPAVLATSDNGAAAGDQPLDIPITATGCSSIGGTKYGDVNSNGGRDAGEAGLGGWQFYVDYDDDGALGAGEPSTTSAADGTWTITGINPGSFKVREVGQASWICTEPAQSDQYGCYYGPISFDGGRVTAPPATFGNHNTVPLIGITKTGPATATAGDLVPYTIVVTNPGEESFADGAVIVTDPQCTTAPVLQVKNRGAGVDATPDSLDPGDSWVYGCSGQTASGQTSFVNQACVEGTDQFGRQVSACDDATTLLGERQVAGTRTEPGTARLAGRSGCVARAFTAVVRGRSIDKVVFRIDGKKRATLRSPDANGRYKLRVDPKAFKPGSHVLVARTTFAADSGTRPKTMRLRFQRCVRRTEPAFTG